MNKFAKDIIDKRNFNDLNETQKKSIDEGIMEDKNHLLVAPTGNGKTMCAEIKMNKVLKNGGNVIYLVPSRQLVRSKKEEINEWCEKDVYSSSKGFREGDVTVTTFESYNASLLNKVGYTDSADLVILDDFHELYSSHRGPSIEKTVTSLLYHDIPIFAMSASVGNPEEISKWINANLIRISGGREIDINEKFLGLDKSSKVESVNSYIYDNQEYLPALVFNSRRSYCESRASNMNEKISFKVNKDYHKIFNSKLNQSLTPKLEKLASLMNNGIAFHHAGLPSRIKTLIEKEFEEKNIKIIYCTTTIAYGFDAPVKTIFVGDIKRYSGYGMDYIGTWEYLQWIGRAGRPGKGFEDAYAFVFSKSPEEAEKKFGGNPKELEDIKSHLEQDYNFRWLMLEIIYSGYNDTDKIKNYYSNSLLSDQLTGKNAWGGETLDPMDIMEDYLKDTTKFLKKRDLIHETKIDSDLEATELGEAFAEFSLFTFSNYKINTLYDFYNWYENNQKIEEKDLIRNLSKTFNITISENNIKTEFKTKLINKNYGNDENGQTAAIILEYWIKNKTLRQISEETGVETTNLKNVAKNISNTMKNLESIIQLTQKGKVSYYDKLNKKIKYGVTGENLKLIQVIDNLGRYRLRKLEEIVNNLSSYHEIRGTNLKQKLIKLNKKLGKQKLKEELQKTEGIGKVTSENIMTYINSN